MSESTITKYVGGDAPADNLIVLDELLPQESGVKDINKKIDILENQLNQLASVFGVSYDLVCTSIEDLKKQDINSNVQLKAFKSQLNRVTDEALQRDEVISKSLNQVVEKFDTDLSSTKDILYVQEDRIETLQSYLEKLDQYSHDLEQQLQDQGDLFDTRHGELIHRISSNKILIEGLQSLHKQQKNDLLDLREQHNELSINVQNLRSDFELLGSDLLLHKADTKLTFMRTHIMIGAFLLVGAVVISFMHFYPGAASAALEQVQNNWQKEQQQQSQVIAVLSEDVSGLDISLTEIKSDADLAGQRQSELKEQVDDIQYMMLGPGNKELGKSEPDLPVLDSLAVLDLNSSHYSLQLLTVYRYQDIVDYINQNKTSLTDYPLYYIQTEKFGLTRFSLFYGVYDSFLDAQRLLSDLPLRVATNKPWIRPVESMQAAVN